MRAKEWCLPDYYRVRLRGYPPEPGTESGNQHGAALFRTARKAGARVMLEAMYSLARRQSLSLRLEHATKLTHNSHSPPARSAAMRPGLSSPYALPRQPFGTFASYNLRCHLYFVPSHNHPKIDPLVTVPSHSNTKRRRLQPSSDWLSRFGAGVLPIAAPDSLFVPPYAVSKACSSMCNIKFMCQLCATSRDHKRR